MKKVFVALLILFFPLTIQAGYLTEWKRFPKEQFIALFGSNSYILYKALDFANDHGYRYIKIIAYQFDAFNQKASGYGQAVHLPGRFFQLVDDISTISLLCFHRLPSDPNIIDVEKHIDFIQEVEETFTSHPPPYQAGD